MPANDLPPHLRTPEAATRLFVLIGYSQEEILDTLMNQFSLQENAARDVLARVTEQQLSAEEQVSSH